MGLGLGLGFRVRVRVRATARVRVRATARVRVRVRVRVRLHPVVAHDGGGARVGQVELQGELCGVHCDEAHVAQPLGELGDGSALHLARVGDGGHDEDAPGVRVGVRVGVRARVMVTVRVGEGEGSRWGQGSR